MSLTVPPLAQDELTIVAIDPGKVSGVAVLQPEVSDTLYTSELTVDETVSAYESLRFISPRTEVVMESFTISQRTLQTALSLDALDLIGYVKLRAVHDPFTLQSPAAAKSFATDEKLKALGWYTYTKDGHQNDAARHLLVYMVQNHKAYASTSIIPQLARIFL